MKTKLIVLLCLILTLPVLSRQRRERQPTPWSAGIYLELSFPQSSAGGSVKTGEGLGLKVLYHIPNYSHIALRGDFGYLSYGETRFQTSYYGLTQTRNEAYRLAFGPEFRTRINKFEIYLSPMISGYNYRTVSSFQDYYGYYGFADTKDSNSRYGWVLAMGTSFDIGLGPFIDFGVKYHRRSSDIYTNSGAVIGNDEISVNIGVLFRLNK